MAHDSQPARPIDTNLASIRVIVTPQRVPKVRLESEILARFLDLGVCGENGREKSNSHAEYAPKENTISFHSLNSNKLHVFRANDRVWGKMATFFASLRN